MRTPADAAVIAEDAPATEFLWLAWQLSDLISMGVPILSALKLCNLASQSPTIQRLCAETHNGVREGESLTQRWETAPLDGRVPAKLLSHAHAGEESGSLDQTLKDFAVQMADDEHPDLTLADFLGRSEELVLFSRRLSDLISEGVPLAGSLKVLLRNEAFAPVESALKVVLDRVEAGSSLSEAMSDSAVAALEVDLTMLAIISVGEGGGVLDIALERIAAQSHQLDS